MEESSGKWIVFVLKDRFSNDTDREALKNSLVTALSLGANDIYYVPLDCNEAMGNFFFVREYDGEDLRKIFECKRDFFESYASHMRITDKEFSDMVDGIRESQRKEPPKHGDIVVVRNGMYSKLYGIVLRENRSSKIEVGMKFCFGTVTVQFSPEELDVIGNIFNYLKVLK